MVCSTQSLRKRETTWRVGLNAVIPPMTTFTSRQRTAANSSARVYSRHNGKGGCHAEVHVQGVLYGRRRSGRRQRGGYQSTRHDRQSRPKLGWHDGVVLLRVRRGRRLRGR